MKNLKEKKSISNHIEQQICIPVLYAARLYRNLIDGVEIVLELQLQINLKIWGIYWIRVQSV